MHIMSRESLGKLAFGLFIVFVAMLSTFSMIVELEVEQVNAYRDCLQRIERR